MGIAVVSSLPRMPLSAAPGELASANASAAGKGGKGADFASILLGLPETLLERTSTVAALGEERQDPTTSGPPGSDAALPTTLGFAFVPPDSRGETSDAPLPAKDDALTADSLPTAIVFTDLPPVAPVPTTGGAALASPTLALSGNDQAAKVAAPPAEPKLVAAEIVVSGDPASNGERLADNQPPRSVATFTVLPHGQAPEGSSDPQQQPVPRLSPPEHLASPLAYHTPLSSNGPQEPVHSLARPLHDPAWNSDFGQKLLWFASNDRQAAQLTLNPPQLGTIEVSLQLDKNSAQAHFVAASPEVRSAIESAVPRLREMLASAGVELGQVSVGSESFRQQADGERQAAQQPRIGSDKAILGIGSAGGLPGAMTITRHGSSLVDTFA